VSVTDTPSSEGIVAWRVISKEILQRPYRSVLDTRRPCPLLMAAVFPSR
jgi:hypothetical protein